MMVFGADVEIIPSEDRKITPELVQAIVGRAKELASEPWTFWADQYNNPDNRAAYHGMAEEIVQQMGGHLDAFVQGVGTGGCFSGNAEVLKEVFPGIRAVAVEPAGAPHLSGGPLGPHGIEGIGPGFISGIMRMDLVDEVIGVSDEDAREMTRRLAMVEGVFGGISSGANLVAALEVAEEIGPGCRVLAVVPDSGLKYLEGHLYR